MDQSTVSPEQRALVSAKLTESLRAEALRTFDWDVEARVVQRGQTLDVIFPGPLEGERIRDAAILEGFIVANVRYMLERERRRGLLQGSSGVSGVS